MTSDLSNIKAAEGGVLAVYQPYYQGSKRAALPYAMSLYEKASLEGERKIEGGESIPFLATWFIVSKLPADMTLCRMQFEGRSELTYEVQVVNHEFMEFLIDLYISWRRTKTIDFSQTFYRKLLRLDD